MINNNNLCIKNGDKKIMILEEIRAGVKVILMAYGSSGENLDLFVRAGQTAKIIGYGSCINAGGRKSLNDTHKVYLQFPDGKIILAPITHLKKI